MLSMRETTGIATFSRRRFLTILAQTGALALAATVIGCKTGPPSMVLPGLPYKEDALEPIVSKKTIQHHYGYHHQGYINRLNNLITETPLAGKPLKEIIKSTVGQPEKQTLFNNAAQVWNHNFYWQSLSPDGGGKPPGTLKKKIDATFGGIKQLKKRMVNAAVSQFGNGWVWLVSENDTLKVVTTGNADLPLASGVTPLLAIDVWEHAYYLDYQHRRADYVEAVMDKLVNWSFARKNLKYI